MTFSRKTKRYDKWNTLFRLFAINNLFGDFHYFRVIFVELFVSQRVLRFPFNIAQVRCEVNRRLQKFLSVIDSIFCFERLQTLLDVFFLWVKLRTFVRYMVQNLVQIDYVENYWILPTHRTVHLYVRVNQILEFHLQPGVYVQRKLLKLSDFELKYFIFFVLSWSSHGLFQNLCNGKWVLLLLNCLFTFLLVLSLVLLCIFKPVDRRRMNRYILVIWCGLNLHFLYVFNSASVQSLQLHPCCSILYFAVCAYRIKSVWNVFCVLMTFVMIFQNFTH